MTRLTPTESVRKALARLRAEDNPSIFISVKVEADLFAEQAGKVRDIGVVQAMYGSTLFIVLTLLASLSTAVIYGLGGALAIVRSPCKSGVQSGSTNRG